MKKLINRVESVVDDMLAGLLRTRPNLALLEGHRVVVRSDFAELASSGKVALISGGGSGHEPAHAGYVGKGMLTAAVCGDVFTSPSVDAVLAAIRAVTGPAGSVLIVKNYTGDRLNFGLAAELAGAEGLQVDVAIVADDASLSNGDDSAGKRGIAGTVLLHKILGAAAENGASRQKLMALSDSALAGLSSMGVALGTCIVPAAGKPNFELGPDEIEFGLGIHGEAGVSREQLRSAKEVVSSICERIFAKLAAGERVAVLINDLGAVTPMELSIVANDVLDEAQKTGLRVDRVFVGRYLTALEMPGVSLSVMPVDDDLVALLDAPSEPWLPGCKPSALRTVSLPAATRGRFAEGAPDPAVLDGLWRALLAVEAAEEELTELDRAVGDGDIGINLARGARAVRAEREKLAGLDPASLLAEVASILRKEVGGTSGALYGAGLLEAAIERRAGANWPRCLLAGANKVAELGRAKVGDGTMLDALVPAADALIGGASLDDALEAGQKGAEKARLTLSRRGRASYLGERSVGTMDPGARAVLIWMQALRLTSSKV
jgi:dihydroxyacetone kinase